MFDYINNTYGLSIKNGDRVLFEGKKTGTIVGTHDANIKVNFDDGETGYCHPTWEMEYL